MSCRRTNHGDSKSSTLPQIIVRNLGDGNTKTIVYAFLQTIENLPFIFERPALRQEYLHLADHYYQCVNILSSGP